MSWVGLKVNGTGLQTDSELKQSVYDLYTAFYENPRPISYLALERMVPVEGEEAGAQEWYAEIFDIAVTLGCRDADNDRDKRPRQEVLDNTLLENVGSNQLATMCGENTDTLWMTNYVRRPTLDSDPSTHVVDR